MAEDAESLHCPNCGAAADPDARRCAYCRARLAAVTCASCFAPMFDGTAFCPKCGAARGRVDTEGSTTPCPACKGELSHVAVGSVTMLECRRCDGVWADAATFEQMCTSSESRAAVLHRAPSAPPPAPQRVRYRPCVRCGKMMNRVNFGRHSGTIVDVCRGHGTFLDAGELHAIVTFIHEGGLERTRQQEVEELKEQQRRLAAAQNHPLRPHAPVELGSAGWDSTALAEFLKALVR
jgi:Zn-finger nucleic acid-binding protein